MSYIQALEEELAGLKNIAEKYHKPKQQWEVKTEEADLLQTKLQQSSYHKQQELDALKKKHWGKWGDFKKHRRS